jgi:hypothetical protein
MKEERRKKTRELRIVNIATKKFFVFKKGYKYLIRARTFPDRH